ncbi:hypothetical protein ACFL2U_03125 [Patescibacteria group bacterium]
MKKVLGLLMVLVIVGCVFGCKRQRELYSTKYSKYFSELQDLSCEEYELVATCEAYAFLQNGGALGDVTYFDGVIAYTGVGGELSRTVPLRCELDQNLTKLVKQLNDKGTSGRLLDSFSWVGTRTVVCDKISLEDVKKTKPEK